MFISFISYKFKNQIVDNILGKPSSNGCVRLSAEDARWMYENIPAKTTVYIK
ncbi:L,D-transpeptidase [Caloramator sp. mosi_1]|uniref:L,D-transpeptidase n=1 Tax=Caloramator sp. mosi_1 TaxID=3023090 RepID=UPI003FCC574A